MSSTVVPTLATTPAANSPTLSLLERRMEKSSQNIHLPTLIIQKSVSVAQCPAPQVDLQAASIVWSSESCPPPSIISERSAIIYYDEEDLTDVPFPYAEVVDSDKPQALASHNDDADSQVKDRDTQIVLPLLSRTD